MFPKIDSSIYIMIDMQDKLLNLMSRADEVRARNEWLLKLTEILGIRTLVSEHCPDKLGPTSFVLLERAAHAVRTARKTAFSVVREKGALDEDDLEKRDVLLSGIEAHVCVLQTALDLKAMGKNVYVVVDAIASRKESDMSMGVARMRDHGVEIVTAEMVAFELLGDARHERFSAVHKGLIK